MVASTWLSDHQGRLSTPTNSLHKLHTARYQVLLTITIDLNVMPVLNFIFQVSIFIIFNACIRKRAMLLTAKQRFLKVCEQIEIV